MKNILLLIATFSLTGCALHSTTYIKPNDAFILGANEHGAFKVDVENTSKTPITAEVYSLDKTILSKASISPSKQGRIKVSRDNAVHIINSSTDTIAVRLKVKGDLNLGMEYRQPQ